jgi:site-specific DNA recombinase
MTNKTPKSKSHGKDMTMKNFEKTAAIYVRKSSIDSREGENMSLSAQKIECENYAKINGFEVVEHYAEAVGTSVSSYSTKNARVLNKALDEMGNKYHTLIVYELSRMTRKSSFSSENVEMINKVVEAGGRLVSLCGMLDTDELDDMGGRIKLLLGIEFAAEESAKISMRAKRGKKEAARRGNWNGGTIPFGLVRAPKVDGPSELVRNDYEIAMFDEICDLILEGMSTQQIANLLNDRGEVTNYGHKWESTKICRMVRAPHWVGHRTFKGEIITHENGEPMMMSWGQLIDPAKFYATRKEIDRRGATRRNSKAHGNRKGIGGKHILTGITFCETCDTRMIREVRTRKQTRADGRVATYHQNDMLCRTCSKAWRVNGPMLDEHVVESALIHLSQQDPSSDMMTEVARVWLHQYDVGTTQMRGKLEGEAGEIEDRKNELLELFTDGMINKEQFKDKTTKLDGKLITIEAELASMPSDNIDVAPLLDLLSCAEGESISGEGSTWSALEEHVQRKIINTIVDKIVIEAWDGPSRTGTKSNIPERTKITFNHDSEAIEKSLRSEEFSKLHNHKHLDKVNA